MPDSAAASRIERTGYLLQDDVTGEYSFVTAEGSPGDNPCTNLGSVGFVEGKTFIAHAHTNPFADLDVLPANCGLPTGARHDAATYG